jgi:hypothetical protein
MRQSSSARDSPRVRACAALIRDECHAIKQSINHTLAKTLYRRDATRDRHGDVPVSVSATIAKSRARNRSCRISRVTK